MLVRLGAWSIPPVEGMKVQYGKSKVSNNEGWAEPLQISPPSSKHGRCHQKTVTHGHSSFINTDFGDYLNQKCKQPRYKCCDLSQMLSMFLYNLVPIQPLTAHSNLGTSFNQTFCLFNFNKFHLQNSKALYGSQKSTSAFAQIQFSFKIASEQSMP